MTSEEPIKTSFGMQTLLSELLKTIRVAALLPNECVNGCGKHFKLGLLSTKLDLALRMKFLSMVNGVRF